MKISKLKKRDDFLNARTNGVSASSKSIVLQTIQTDKGQNASADSARIGFTVSKKVGNAVVRNRIKRRLRALAKEVITQNASPNYDFVLIGRRAALTRLYSDMKKDLIYLLHTTKTHRKV